MRSEAARAVLCLSEGISGSGVGNGRWEGSCHDENLRLSGWLYSFFSGNGEVEGRDTRASIA